MITILVVLAVLMLLGAIPTWPHNILILLLVTGRL
jgi:Protein of unknown function (DUF3309)